ncbi:MAG: putative acetyltransferase [Syntrophorhabdaceae bacterium PtaU1.Bin034]|nr:MAG: putative acetyltransferase [Syntrophorhabdaceae bacterium PtaU1.Bin034]
MNIRKAVPDDALGIAKAHVDSWRSAYRGLVPDDRLAGMDCSRRAGRFRESITQEEELIYVAEDAIGIAGFLALGPCRDPGIDSTATAEVYALYLAPEHWRKGMGRMMSREAERILEDQGYSRVVLWVFEGNTRGRLFYEAMGFVGDGATKTMDVGVPMRCIRYGKDL